MIKYILEQSLQADFIFRFLRYVYIMWSEKCSSPKRGN
jgi:hypothetical protein